MAFLGIVRSTFCGRTGPSSTLDVFLRVGDVLVPTGRRAVLTTLEVPRGLEGLEVVLARDCSRLWISDRTLAYFVEIVVP